MEKPAFPNYESPNTCGDSGMSLRDYYATHIPLRIVGDGAWFEDYSDAQWCELLGLVHVHKTGIDFIAARTHLEMTIRLYRADIMLTVCDSSLRAIIVAERERCIEAVEGAFAGSIYSLPPSISALIVERIREGK